MEKLLISICIPSYNRPFEIRRLLNSIDTSYFDAVEIVICEDNAPLREDVRQQVAEYKEYSKYEVRYIENETNCGYDRNLRNLIHRARGKFILFMGDDDMFVPGALDNYLKFVEEHQHCGYILRSYRNCYADGSNEDFRYFDEDKDFPASKETYISLFDKSVFVSGFTVRRDCANEFESDRFDSSLLYQMYLLAEICYKYPAAYSRIIITKAIEGGTQFFGSSDVEKGLYTPGIITIDNSLNFMNWYIRVIDFIAKEHNDDSNEIIKKNMSKYSYPVLEIQRDKGLKEFKKYKDRLVEMGYGCSFYFYFYYYALIIFGPKLCRKVIIIIKRVIGHRPRL